MFNLQALYCEVEVKCLFKAVHFSSKVKICKAGFILCVVIRKWLVLHTTKICIGFEVAIDHWFTVFRMDKLIFSLPLPRCTILYYDITMVKPRWYNGTMMKRSRLHLMELSPFLYLEFYTKTLMLSNLSITLPFLNISLSNFQILLLMTTLSWWRQVL
jgi:hypothetical protein